MTARLALLLAWIMSLALAAAPASASPEKKSFYAALYQTPVGENGMRTMSFALLLRDMKRQQEADALRLAAMYRYVDLLNGVPPEAGLTLGRMIETGKSLPPLDDTWLARWQDGLARSVVVEWPDDGRPAPGELDPYLRDRERLGPGIWRVNFNVPRVYVVAVLLNRSSEPLPMLDLAMMLPGGADPVRFDCKFERPRHGPQYDQVLTLKAGDRATMLCTRDLPPQDERNVLDRLAAARSAGPAPRLQALPPAREPLRLLQDWGHMAGGAPYNTWGSAMRVAERDTQLEWRAAGTPLDVPVVVPSLAQHFKNAGKAVSTFLALSMAPLMLFVAGRAFQRLGVPLPLVVVVTIGVSLAVGWSVASHVAGPNPTAGEGWQRGATTGFIAFMGVGFVLTASLMLHVLHKRLDEDEISWLETVISGWRNAFRWTGTASSGEFWGFYAHCVWLLLGVNMVPRPWNVPFCALILVAMATMATRRFAAFRFSEQVAMVAVVVLYVISLFLDW
jgi:hypothetical protein